MMRMTDILSCKDEFDQRFQLKIRNYFYKKYFKKYGDKNKIAKPLMIINPQNISIGNYVSIRSGARLEAVTKWHNRNYTPHIQLGNNITIEQNCHIVCANSVIIKDGVLISSNVFITDLNHNYSKVNTPVMKQLILVKKTIIMENCFIGTGAKIMAGVSIGKNCIIGANSVVTKDIPDYSVVTGIPAKIIKRYNFINGQWEKY